MGRKMWYILTALVFSVVLVGAYELLYAKYSGETVPVPDIPRSEQVYGEKANELRYVVMGDSTGVGQGAEYSESIAVKTAEHLTKGYTVRLANVAVSGATTHDVLHEQVPKVVTQNPDLVLIAVGANDVVRLSRIESVQNDMSTIVAQLHRVNPKVQIFLTGAPPMGTVPRFLWPLSTLAKLRTDQINHAYKKITEERNLKLIPLAEKAESAFLSHPEYFASDNFHPNSQGYGVWSDIINYELERVYRDSTKRPDIQDSNKML